MQINREDVVQAALTVERWCREQRRREDGSAQDKVGVVHSYAPQIIQPGSRGHSKGE